MIELGLIIGLAIGVAMGYLLLKSSVLKNSLPKDELDKRYVLRELYAESSDRLKKKEEELNEANRTILELTAQLAKLNSVKEEMENLHIRSQEQFKNLANEILEEKSKKFTEQNKQNINEIMNPLRDKIKDFQDKIEKNYVTESNERSSLKTEIKNLLEMNQALSKDANNLALALKGDSKKQGNWGEIILEKVLERSGLEKGREYEVQYSLVDSEGSRHQPDVVVFLPGDKHIIVDSKVSLVAYEAFISAPTEEEKESNLVKHVVSVKRHIDELGKKNYQSLPNLNAPDFVLLFMPIESSFSLAVQADNELFNYAWDRKIVIVSPSTLLATLRTIASTWKQEKQARNVFEIAEESGKLYDKFCNLVEDLINVGRKMEAAKESYNEAMKKVSMGPGNIVKRIENIKKLGAKATKSLPSDLLSRAGEE